LRATRLNPEKITHPFQLMAAWFAMLIILVGVLLAGASRIATPPWIPGFLVVSSVGLSVLVMIAVLLMLTRFRPHLQSAKEYAEWLKDERRFRGQSRQTLEIREVREDTAVLAPLVGQDLSDIRLFRQIATHFVEVSNLTGSQDVLGGLRRLGFRAEIYRSEQEAADAGKLEEADHTAIWIGARVPPRVAILAIKTVVGLWPYLRYMHLSSDSTSRYEPPDYIHDQLFFGGATRTAEDLGLGAWMPSEIAAVPDDTGMKQFHDLIRSKYA